MATARFWVDTLPSSGTLTIDGPEAKHINSVLRMTAGDEVIAFDGYGGEATCKIESVEKKTVTLAIVRRSDTDRELKTELHLVVALPKGDRQRTLVEGLVQLGVSSLTPLATTRGVAQPSTSALQRLERYVVEASKQSGRNTLMKVGEPVDVVGLSGSFADCSRLVAHPYAATKRLPDVLRSASQGVTDAGACFAVGPEGGFTEAETESLVRAGWQAISLGKRILRVEMAAIMVASAIAALTE